MLGQATDLSHPPNRTQISGVFPHLAVTAGHVPRSESGIGALMPWAEKLWFITYPCDPGVGTGMGLFSIDAATGATLRTYAGTQQTDEIVVSDGLLLALVRQRPNTWHEYQPETSQTQTEKVRVHTQWAWDNKPASIVALDPESGEKLIQVIARRDSSGTTFAFTNHTLLPEALEKWPVPMFENLLPRLLEIIYEINAKFLAVVARRWPGDTARLARMSIIEEGETPQVRMAHLAIVGSFSVNGVAELHSRLLTEELFQDFYALWPEKFNNKTNGVTQRRWLSLCNPRLSGLISEHIGDGWVTRLEELHKLAPYAEDAKFRQRWREVKLANKQRLAELVQRESGVLIDTSALFDVQVKRIHEYKRQLLNALHVVHLYNRIKRGDVSDWTRRCVLVGGKAAPGYAFAKNIKGGIIDLLEKGGLRIVAARTLASTSVGFARSTPTAPQRRDT